MVERVERRALSGVHGQRGGVASGEIVAGGELQIEVEDHDERDGNGGGGDLRPCGHEIVV